MVVTQFSMKRPALGSWKRHIEGDCLGRACITKEEEKGPFLREDDESDFGDRRWKISSMVGKNAYILKKG